jgi:hypothetical protein
VKLINRIVRPAAISGAALLLVAGAAFAAGGRLPDLSVPNFPSPADATPTNSAGATDKAEAIESTEPSHSPEAAQTAEPSESPEAAETAEASESPEAAETHSADGSGKDGNHSGSATESSRPSSSATDAGHGGDSGRGGDSGSGGK